MAQQIKFLALYLFFTVISSNFQVGSAQGMNLLQNYLRQYFKEFSPNTVRSYTLYGNGQNGAADFQAGLPYPMETTGKVNNLHFSPMTNPLPNPGQNQRTVSSQNAPQKVKNPFVNNNPVNTNSFNPWKIDPSQIKINIPDPVMKYVSSSRSDLQVGNEEAESGTMVTSGEVGQGQWTNEKDNSREIAIQSSLAFRK